LPKQSPDKTAEDCFVAKNAPHNDRIEAFAARHYLASIMIHELSRLSGNQKKCHCEAFFAAACFLGSQSPVKTAEIASSPKTLLAMTVPGYFPDTFFSSWLFIY